MTHQEQIKYFFKELSANEQQELLLDLQNVNSGISIVEFSVLVQRLYKKSVTFEIRTDIVAAAPLITAICVTPEGEFSATGKNKKIAKYRAVQKAFEKINNSPSK